MSTKSIENLTGPFVHTVFFWLKNPKNKDDQKTFKKAIRKMIQTNTQAISNHLGCAAKSEKRDVVDNSFTYCFIMIFPDLKTQNLYQNDPTHILFIEEASHLWEKVRVHDSISIDS
jgi:hypothetical protein